MQNYRPPDFERLLSSAIPSDTTQEHATPDIQDVVQDADATPVFTFQTTQVQEVIQPKLEILPIQSHESHLELNGFESSSKYQVKFRNNS